MTGDDPGAEMPDPIDDGAQIVGVISDTHGLLRPEAVEALDVDEIVHAGDVGEPQILDVLGKIAPVTAVRGNVDRGPWSNDLPWDAVLQVNDAVVYVIHIVDELELDPAAAGFDAVVFGHSHRPEVRRQDGVLYLNPGSAGPRRFDLPVSLARLEVVGGGLEAELIELEV